MNDNKPNLSPKVDIVGPEHILPADTSIQSVDQTETPPVISPAEAAARAIVYRSLNPPPPPKDATEAAMRIVRGFFR